MKTRTLIKKFDLALDIFRFKALTLQEIALALFDLEIEHLSPVHLRKAYKFLHPLLMKNLVSRLRNPSILRRVGTNKPVYALTEEGFRLARLINPVLIRRTPFLHEYLFLTSYDEARKEIEKIIGEKSDRVVRGILPHKYRIGKNLLILKSDKKENWQKKYSLFPYLRKEEFLNLFSDKGFSVAELVQKIFDGRTIVPAEMVLSHVDGSILVRETKLILPVKQKRLVNGLAV